MKKILLIIVFALIIIGIPVTVFLVKQRQDVRQRAVPATTLFISPAESTHEVGETFALNIEMDTGQNHVAAAEINVSVNPQYLEIISFDAGSFLPTTLVGSEITGGTVKISVGVQLQQGTEISTVNGTGTAAVLTLKAIAPTQPGTPTEVRINQAASRVGDPTEQNADNTNVLLATQHGRVIITETGIPSQSPEPSPQPTLAPGVSPQPSATPVTGGTDPTQSTQVTSPANGSTTTNNRPPIAGTSFDDALVILSINSDQQQEAVITATFYADAQGNWTYTPTTDLAPGSYTLTVTGQDDDTDSVETATSAFTVLGASDGDSQTTVSPTPTPTPAASPGTGGGTDASATPTATATSSGVPVTGSTTPTYLLLGFALIFLVFGGVTFAFQKEE